MSEGSVKKKILVVDDEPSITALLASRLTDAGFEVMTAGNGLEAYGIVKVQAIDLVAMDRMMPKMDGIKTCALLKADRRFSHIPVMIFTASADKNDEKLSMDAGADVFLTKPLDMGLFIIKVNELLKQG